MTRGFQLQQDLLLRSTERMRLVNVALDFIGNHGRPITELPVVLEAMDKFLRPELSPEEILDGLRRLRQG